MFHPWLDATPLTIKLRYILPLQTLKSGVFFGKNVCTSKGERETSLALERERVGHFSGLALLA